MTTKTEFSKLFDLEKLETEKEVQLYFITKTGNLKFKGKVEKFLETSISYKPVYSCLASTKKIKYNERLLLIPTNSETDAIIRSFSAKKSLLYEKIEITKYEKNKAINEYIRSIDFSEIKKPFEDEMEKLNKESTELFEKEFLPLFTLTKK